MYQFAGRDWTELPKALGIEVLEHDPELPLNLYWEYEEDIADKTIVLLGRAMNDKGQMKEEHKELVIAFITALAESPGAGYDRPMYETMLKIESDGTLLQWLGRNLRGMWT